MGENNIYNSQAQPCWWWCQCLDRCNLVRLATKWPLYIFHAIFLAPPLMLCLIKVLKSMLVNFSTAHRVIHLLLCIHFKVMSQGFAGFYEKAQKQPHVHHLLSLCPETVRVAPASRNPLYCETKIKICIFLCLAPLTTIISLGVRAE